MDQKKIEAQVKGKFENLNANCGPKKNLKAQVKGKSENLYNCQLWTKNF